MKITVSQRRKCQQQCKHGRAQVIQPLGLFSFSQLPKAVSVCARDKLAHCPCNAFAYYFFRASSILAK
jgi:hypothetical protein